MPKITSYSVDDVRYPTSLSGDGTDAMNKECDYSAAYVTLKTDSDLIGYGMTFTIGRGNDIVCTAVHRVAQRLVGSDTETLFCDMGATWSYLLADPQLRWIGPEKGVIHIATAAVVNAVWDMFAKARGKPLWKLIVDFTPEEFVKCVAFRYLTDVITPEESLEMLRSKQAGRAEREAEVIRDGYPAYTTSVGWFGYSDDKVARLTKEAINQGFNHFKVKVGADLAMDQKRLGLVRSIIDDPANYKERRAELAPTEESLKGKNAGPLGGVLMIDANQVWDVPQAIDYVKQLAQYKPWFIEEPTAPDDALGHAAIRKALKPVGVGVATGEHAHNRMVFKQLLQAEAIDVCQIDSCRLAGVNEILAVMLMAQKFGVSVCPHAGGVGLCEHVIHLSLIDYICISGRLAITEFVDHLHENFPYPSTINLNGKYNVPMNPKEGYSIEMFPESIAKFKFPDGAYWSSDEAKKAHKMVDEATLGFAPGLPESSART